MRNALKSGIVQWIAMGELESHPLAQRQFDAAWANEIAVTFKPDGLGTITVAKTKKGKLWIVDGQHRHKAALQWLDGDTSQHIACMVIDVENDAEAAELFLLLNNHKAVKTLDKFFVRITAKDPVAIAIVATLEKHGLRVERTRKAGVVQAVRACESILNRQRGALLLERVIRVLRATWGDDADAYHGQIIQGLGLLFAKFGPAVDDEELARKLAKRGGPLGIIGRARQLRDAKSGSIAQATYETIREEYNKGRRTERLEERAA